MESDKTHIREHGGHLTPNGDNDKTPQGHEQVKGINPSLTTEPNCTPFGDKVSDENQYIISSTLSLTLNRDGHPIITPHADENTSSSLTRAMLGIHERCFG